MSEKIFCGVYINNEGELCELFDIAFNGRTGEKMAIYCLIDKDKKINRKLVYTIPLADFLEIEEFKYVCPSVYWEEFRRSF